MKWWIYRKEIEWVLVGTSSGGLVGDALKDCVDLGTAPDGEYLVIGMAPDGVGQPSVWQGVLNQTRSPWEQTG